MKKYYTIIFCLSSLLLTHVSTAQPRLVGTLAYTGPQNGGIVFRNDLPSTTPSIIHAFNNLAPHGAMAGVVAGDNNWLYGILNYNGATGDGGLFRIQRDGSGFTLLYNFTGNSQVMPVYHTDGSIYFTDDYQIKKFNPANNSVTDVGNGGFVKKLLIDSDDWMYFTNFYTLSKMKTDGTGYIDLHTFNSATEGSSGFAGLTETPGDSLFGVNTVGGTTDEGTLYSLKKDGSGFTVLHQFTAASGSIPESKLVYFDGKLYGTTSYGGIYGLGVLYTINTDGTGYRVLHHFDPGSPAIGYPSGNISIAANGRIFGSFGQFYYYGGSPYRLFKVDTSGENFEPFINAQTYNQRDYGHFNQDVLLTDNDETIFLITREMGRHDGGVLSVFDTSGFVGTSLHHFGFSPLGFKPMGGLIKGSDQKLYGTTIVGGPDGNGTVYSMNADGSGYAKVHEFLDAEGYELSGKLLQASDGKLYGAAHWGGPTNSGTIYRMNKNGSSFQVIYTFPDFLDAYSPVGGLVEDNTGVLYGAAFYSAGAGSIFKINKDGSNFTLLKIFNSTDIGYPSSGLTLFGNYLYGTCFYGGVEGKGGVFRIRKDGTGYQELHIFQGATDGSAPYGTLYLASNAKLYGTTSTGGSEGLGTVFRIDTSGSNYIVLKNFSSTADGTYPYTGIIQASDLLLYGSTTSASGLGVYGGTIFRMNLDGSGYTVLHAFDDQAEGQGISTLLDLNGNFVLPVELLSFNAEKKGGSVLLTWKTAQEQKSNRFEIERSADGISYHLIGTVAASGNTSTVTTYSLIDHQPFDGINYYRLKQVDIDGLFAYSKIVSADFGKSGKLTVFPNPASDRLHVRWPQDGNFTQVRIVNSTGQVVLQKNVNSSTTELNLEGLPKGWYTLQLIGKENNLEKRFLKE
jgi:uncharacterized repeat protein (TIGR03803 family)